MNRKGFTLVELLVAMAIMVVAFGLVTFLYTKAARIRKVVVVTSEIQQMLSQIVNTLTYGNKTNWGMLYSTGLDSTTQYDTFIVLRKGADTMTVKIDSAGNITMNSMVLNIGEKVIIDVSYPVRFEYFDRYGNKFNTPVSPSDSNKISFIKIVLWAKSTDPVMKFADPVPLVTGVRLRGKTSFE
ncbi:MAG: type II secretion system GspH family protein [bacterium]|nr:type II secretion system GspH family protein [bacterium]